jgi:uncharacterized protein YciI
MIPSFYLVKRARLASVARPRHAKIFREIPRASAATRALAFSGPSVAVDAGVAAGRIAEAVNEEDVRDSNAEAPADRGMTAVIRAATPAHPGDLS